MLLTPLHAAFALISAFISVPGEPHDSDDAKNIAMPGSTILQSTLGGRRGVSATSTGLRPPQVPFDVEHYPAAPAGLQLEQVHFYVRHGERTPVGVRMSEPPASIPEHWMMCKTGRQFRAAVAELTKEGSGTLPSLTDGEMNVRKVVERPDGTVHEGQCLLGELTDTGRQLTYNFGVALRKLYVDKLGFLPDTLTDPSDVYFRSTNMPRTIESLQQIIHGLYPSSKVHPGAAPALRVRNGKDENLIGNTYACKRLEVLLAGFAQAAAAAYNHTLEPLDKKLSKYIGGNPIRIDGKPRASGILDTVRASTAHGVKVPPEFEEKLVIDLLERAVVHEWFADKTEEVRRLGMGRLFADLRRRILEKANPSILDEDDAQPPKILVHSTHDTGLAALCSALDVFDERWPPFTASISFELFSREETVSQPSYLQSLLSSFSTTRRKPEHYVRMRYMNRTLPLPMCAEEGKHLPGSPEFCTMAAFLDRIKELTPDDWEAECAASPAR